MEAELQQQLGRVVFLRGEPELQQQSLVYAFRISMNVFLNFLLLVISLHPSSLLFVVFHKKVNKQWYVASSDAECMPLKHPKLVKASSFKFGLI